MSRRTQADAQHLTERAYKRVSKPVGGDDLVGQHTLAGVSVGIDIAEAATLEDRVRRWANRHECQAPARFSEALARVRHEDSGAELAAVVAEKIRADPGAYCGDPRHREDAVWLAETLELLGLRETVRKRERSQSISARPCHGHGWCTQCGRKLKLHLDGTVIAHKPTSGGDHCPGSARFPEEVAD